MPFTSAAVLPETSLLEDVTTLRALPSSFADFLVSSRRHLHQYPEIGFQEHNTSHFIRVTLSSHGLDVRGPIAETGLYVDIVGAHPGPHVGYRADIDALPIQDAKQVPYASQNAGVAHLCGHDAHTTVGIGVALLLHHFRDQLHGTVRVFFQPNEESAPSGAVAMIRDGVLDGLEAVYAIHVDPTVAVGKYGLLVGPITAAADRFRITIRGERTGHSARPHQVVDTVWVTTQIMNAIYQLTGRVTDARNAAVLTICQLEAGEAYNVIPEKASFGGTLRSTNADEREHLKRYIRHTAEHLAELHNAVVDVVWDQGAPAVVNDARLVGNVETTILELFGPEAAHSIPLPSMGSEDFAHYLQYVPGALIRVGTSSGPRTSHALHDACFDLDEAALAPTVQLMTRSLMNLVRQD